MKAIKVFCIFIQIFLLLTINAIAVSVQDISVSPDSTNHYGKYTIDSRLTGSLAWVEANIDSIVIEFNAQTVLPASISPSLVTVNSVSASAVSVNGQRLSILSPVELRNFLGGERNFTVEISASAKIRNPGTNGSYTVDVSTVNSNGSLIGPTDTSPAYSIYTSNSTITPPTVSPSPSIAGQAAEYNITFFVGSGGFLTSGSGTISLTFDAETFVPTGAISGVTVNGTPATAVGNNSTVEITTPSDIENSALVEIDFALGSGLVNPDTGGTYNISAYTSSETTSKNSQDFDIADQGDFTISGVQFTPQVINSSPEMEVGFYTSSTGALSAANDSIFLILPVNMYIPNIISTSDVLISSGGFSSNPTTVMIMNDNSTDNDTIALIPTSNIGAVSEAVITFQNSAGILNPSESGSYSIQLRTSQDQSFISSNSFQISSSTTNITQPLVTPGSSNRNATTNYQFEFNLGSKGRLWPGTSTVLISFHANYTLSTVLSRYNNTRISVDGGAFETISTSLISIDNTTKEIEITIPSTVITANSDNIVLILDGTSTDPITNPGSSDNYTVGISTSVEPTEVTSLAYAIGGTAVTLNSFTLSNSSVNNASQYTINLVNSSRLSSITDDYLKIVFPEGTTLPSSISTANITINGSNPAATSVVQDSRTLTASISQFFLNSGTNITMIISSSAGIINPSVPSESFYRGIVSTNQDISPVTSDAYAIVGNNTQVSSVSASVSPAVRDAQNAAYTMNFTTGSDGALAGGTSAGSSTITINFDTVTTVPASIAASAVKVNTNISGGAEILQSGDGGVVRVTLPDGLSVDDNSAVEVAFQSSAGLDTRNFSGKFNVRIQTSSDTVFCDTTGTSADYQITEAQDLYVNAVSPNPTTQNASAGYSINFTTGSLGALSAGDFIYLVFPSNTVLPSVFNKNDVYVAAQNPSINPIVSGDTLKISVPDTIQSLADVTVLLSQSANIINPTIVQGYALKLFTDAETTPQTSPTYNITQTTQTVTVADVTLSDQGPSADSKYTLDFSVGSNGRLLAGSSTITVTFNASTTVNSSSANYDSTYIYVDGSYTQITTGNISISGQQITFTVPAGLSIDNNDDIQLIINNSSATKPIANPAVSGNYTLQVKTSVETQNVTSNAFTISSTSPVSNVTMVLGSDEANAFATDTVSFRVQNSLSAGSGTITVIFPYNTLVPVSISPSLVRLASNSTNPVSFSAAQTVSTNPSTRTVTITVATTINSTDSVRVAFTTAAGIENPSNAGNYRVKVKTSSQPLERFSAYYSITPATTSINEFTVDITPNTPGSVGAYQFGFTTGANGRLVSGSSIISLVIPHDAIFSQGTPQTSKVRVNATSSEQLRIGNGAGTDPDTLEITVPTSVTIGNNTGVVIVVDSTAGLRNATSTGSLNYYGFTSVEGNAIPTEHSLPVELSSFSAESNSGLILLNWITESELENAYWIIERKEISDYEYELYLNGSLDLQESAQPFEFISRIDGQGTTTNRTEYIFTDSTVVADQVYAYRIADVSLNGFVTYHNVIFEKAELPLNFHIGQNYPNPFNPTTTIKYTLPENADVVLKVFNILGQEVITLQNGIKKAGYHSLNWDGRNNHHNLVSSGIYIYAFKARSLAGGKTYHKVRKMIFMK